jgi:hypothetical protein
VEIHHLEGGCREGCWVGHGEGRRDGHHTAGRREDRRLEACTEGHSPDRMEGRRMEDLHLDEVHREGYHQAGCLDSHRRHGAAAGR